MTDLGSPGPQPSGSANFDFARMRMILNGDIPREVFETARARAKERLRTEIKANSESSREALIDYTEGRLSRRNMFKTAVMTAIGYWCSKDVLAKMQAPDAEPSGSIRKTGWPRVKEIAWDTVFYQVGSMCFSSALVSLGIRTGNASSAGSLFRKPRGGEFDAFLEKMLDDPEGAGIRIYHVLCVRAPIIEEALFRIIPSYLSGGAGKRWDVGIPTSALFALLHNLTARETPGLGIPLGAERKLALTWVPLPQFMMGCYFWYLMREHGALAALLTHSGANHLSGLPMLMGGRGLRLKLDMFTAEEVQQIMQGQGGPRPA